MQDQTWPTITSTWRSVRDGTLYAAVKPKHPVHVVPPLYLLVRRPQPGLPGGVWDNTLYPIDPSAPASSESGSGRRPHVVLTKTRTPCASSITTLQGTIYFRESDADDISFGPRNQVLERRIRICDQHERYLGGPARRACDEVRHRQAFSSPPTPVWSATGRWTKAAARCRRDASGWGNHANLDRISDVVARARKGLAVNFDGSTSYGVVSDQWALDATTGLTLARVDQTAGPGRLRTSSAGPRSAAVDGYSLSLIATNAPTNPRTVVMQLNEASVRQHLSRQLRHAVPDQRESPGCTWRRPMTAPRCACTSTATKKQSSLGPPSIAANLINVGIGAQANGARKFRGQLDDVRIYRRALSAAEITELSQRAVRRSSHHEDRRHCRPSRPASRSTYTISVSNAGPDGVLAVVTDALPSRLTAATWTCTATGGASCHGQQARGASTTS